MTWKKIRAILQLGRKAEIWLVLPIKFEYFIIEKLNLQKISHIAKNQSKRYIACSDVEALNLLDIFIFDILSFTKGS